MITQATCDLLRTYVADHGAKAMLEVISVILEERAKTVNTEPAKTTAAINASVIRDAMKRIV